MMVRDAPPAMAPTGGPYFPRAVSGLFSSLTDLRLRYLPAPANGLDWNVGEVARTCCDRELDANGAPLPSGCERCLKRNLRRALEGKRLGHRFRGRCGAQMFLLPVDGERHPLGMVALRSQATRARSRARGRKPFPGGAGPDAADSSFHRATLLLCHLANEVAMRHRVTGLASDLDHLRDALTAHEREVHRLRVVLERLIPPALRGSEAKSVGRATLHPAVQNMLDWIHRNYARPFALKEIAEQLGMNASYLSFLFSRELGLPFRSYLVTLRLQRAQDLLRNRHMDVAEVAEAVGYTSSDRFRAAFRQWSGLAPGRWRRVYGRV